MKEYNVSIEIQGDMVPVGTISGENTSEACFRYSEAYCSRPGAAPISLSLPLQQTSFSARQTKNFFEGLLPEGFTRRSVARSMRLDEEDYLSILHGLGSECIGAVRITAGEEHAEAAYEPISSRQVRALAEEGASKSAELVTKSHLSLTGASGKVGLYYDAAHDAWYLPSGTAPSTHIVKQSHVRLNGIVANEQLSLRTAARCGIETPASFIINTGAGTDAEVLLAVQRYDRVFTGASKNVSGLTCPLRLHQEDFAQAMGISAADKYERAPEEYLSAMFELLRKHSADPITDQLKLWDILVFDYLIGNTDAHIKNFSLLYSPDMRTLRLAPAYDVLSTIVYESSTRDMAFSIGGQYSLDELNIDCFRAAAKSAGLGERMAMQRFAAIRERFRPALAASVQELDAMGFDNAAETADRILLKGGIAHAD